MIPKDTREREPLAPGGSTLPAQPLSENGPVPRPAGKPRFRSSPVRFIVTSTFALVSVISITAAETAPAQSIAQRVTAAPDGVAHLQFASRPGTCGNGRDMVGYREALFADSFQSMG